ncbi:MAG: DUF302 domain-containing protein [Geminicoccaceae bacterium]
MLKSFAIAVLCCFATSAIAAEGLVVKPSNYSVVETIDRLEAVLQEKGLKIFARIDHQAGAAGADLDLPPTQLLIFGNPKLGTPLMTSAPTTAIDLPQKALAYEDAAGKVHLVYNDIGYLQARHGIEGRDEVIAKVRGALGKFTDAATK